ncbi:MAG TPA: NAD(P)H-hydrate dehydratase [Rhizomicrobium sp.]|jgi:NAD(P)H-hydrate epimerase|nr:NAD(P)H-hydrate dehydratase [Rhizomicrobium sp.]
MANEILTIAQCYEADRYAATHGVPSLTLMENAGRAVADAIIERHVRGRAIVLCGPGNNGGDGFVAARHLAAFGWEVSVAQLGEREGLKGDAAEMAKRWDGAVVPLASDTLEGANVVLDALFGAGLTRPLEGRAAEIVRVLKGSDVPIVAVDVPSGLHGDLGRGLDDLVVKAGTTVTFLRKKPAHVLMPGRQFCGDVVVADIGIPDAALESIKPGIFENGPALWGRAYPWPQPLAHKYARGHCVVVSGPAHATGAARLAARGALRIGAGLVSVASPPDAVPINAAQLTAIMVKPFDGAKGLGDLLSDRRLNAVVIGPGCGVGQQTRDLVAAVLASGAAAVLDADALTSFHDDPAALFRLLREPAVLTPHEGEFERVFPGLLAKSENKIEAVRAAAATARCTVLLKGPDTVIAAPDGRAIVNSHAPPTLATAGSGDVLSGFIGGLMAQRLDSFTAAAAAAWLHGKAASGFGPGLISEDLPELLPAALSALEDELDERYRHPPRGTG